MSFQFFTGKRGGNSLCKPFILFLSLAFTLVFLPRVEAQIITLTSLGTGTELIQENGVKLFPNIYFTDVISALNNIEASQPYWVYTQEERSALSQVNEDHTSILLNNDIIAFYGHPKSKNMGILGRYSIEDLDKKLTDLAAEYAAVNGGRGVLKAFYIIYGTCWPEGEIGYIGEDILKKYIEYAEAHDILVFIDHQIGRYDPVKSLARMLPWLRYPNVHLALDPEWRTTKPMVEIGTVTAAEINDAQRVMENYIVENKIPGERMLVIHQFNYQMIKNRPLVDSDFNRVRLIHCADGFGPPHLKRASYAYNAEAENMPIKAFKLFYNLGIPGAGYDSPLLTPREVYALNPRPYIIMYQ
jgi:hypothetical protein